VPNEPFVQKYIYISYEVRLHFTDSRIQIRVVAFCTDSVSIPDGILAEVPEMNEKCDELIRASEFYTILRASYK